MKIRPNRTIAVATATILVLAVSGLALAQGPHGGGKGDCSQARCDGDGPGIERMAARLDLNEEQVKVVTDLQEQSRQKNEALRKDMLRLRNELQGELLKDTPDTKAAKGLVAKIGDLRTQMQQNRMETRLAVRQQLTPEQRDKMLMMGEGHGERGGRGARGGCGSHGGQGRHGGCGGGGGDCPRSGD